MNKSMIIELIGSNKSFMEDIDYNTEEYKKLQQEFDDIMKDFCAHMNEKDKFDMIWKIDMLQGGIITIASEEFFKQGFRLGLILGAQNFLD